MLPVSPDQAERARKVLPGIGAALAHKHLSLLHPLRLVALLVAVSRTGGLLHHDAGASGYPPMVAQTIVRQLDTAREHINLGSRVDVHCSARLGVALVV